MDANEISDKILSYVKCSNLNYSLTESPFSILLSIRKSFIKYKSNNPPPFRVPGSLLDESKKLESVIKKYEIDLEESNNTIHELSLKLEKVKVEVGDLMNTNKKHIEAKQAVDEKLDDKLSEIVSLKRAAEDKKIHKEKMKLEINSLNKTEI